MWGSSTLHPGRRVEQTSTAPGTVGQTHMPPGKGNMVHKIRIRIKGVPKMYIFVNFKDARHLYNQSQNVQYVKDDS